MSLEEESLAELAVRVGDVLRRNRIRAVLTGGACASLYSGGRYPSIDMDFVLEGVVDQETLDAAMQEAGLQRRGDRYIHPQIRFFVEFPRGPLAVGSDHDLRPVLRRTKRATTLALSATDSCRDRLAAFYHWNDHQSLEVAVEIALRHRVGMSKIRRWSDVEGASDRFLEFESSLRRARAARSAGS